MLSKARIKHITSLHHVKYRTLHHEFIGEGVKVVNELLQSRFRAKQIFALHDWADANGGPARDQGAELFVVGQKDLERISALTTPNKVLAVFEMPSEPVEIITAADELVLLLEDIRDPGNLGTIIRTADWFGIRMIVCSPFSVEVYNPKCVQATMGSIARVMVFYRDLAAFIHSAPAGMQAFATLTEGENIYKTELPAGGLLLIGSEAHGLSPGLIGLCHKKLCIPLCCGKPERASRPESLNASVSAAIACSEFRRRI